MAGTDDLLPSSGLVANLTLVLGIGALGDEVVSDLRRLLEGSEDGHSRAVEAWCRADSETSPTEAANRVLSNRNLDSLEQAGFQIPGRRVGQPVRLNLA